MKNSSFYSYLPVDERELDWGLYMTTCGRRECGSLGPRNGEFHPQQYQFNPAEGRVLPEYQLIWFDRGRGTFNSKETGERELKEGDALLLFPDVWHTYRPDPEIGWDDYWVGFNGSDIFEMCRRGVFSPTNPILHPQRQDEMAEAFESLIKRVQREPFRRAFAYSPDVLKILALCVDKERDEEETPDPGKATIVQEAIRCIWNWSYRVLTVEKLAQTVGVDRRSLERYFREVQGRSILEEIQRCRVSRAQRLLELTRLPIGRVARMVGFSSPEHIRRVFRERFGLSPEAYRQKRTPRPN